MLREDFFDKLERSEQRLHKVVRFDYVEQSLILADLPPLHVLRSGAAQSRESRVVSEHFGADEYCSRSILEGALLGVSLMLS